MGSFQILIAMMFIFLFLAVFITAESFLYGTGLELVRLASFFLIIVFVYFGYTSK